MYGANTTQQLPLVLLLMLRTLFSVPTRMGCLSRSLAFTTQGNRHLSLVASLLGQAQLDCRVLHELLHAIDHGRRAIHGIEKVGSGGGRNSL